MAEKKKISSEDEAWLNHKANMVDEQQVIEALETASDYERGFQRLNDVQKGLEVLAPNPTIPISSLLNDTHAQDPIINAEKAVQHALNSLESKGVLHHSNRMDIEALLNLASEILDEATDEEILQAMVDAHKVQDESEITGGDDVDDDAQIEAPLTHCEVLKAVHFR